MSRGTNLYAASRQWANRPADERFWGLSDLSEHLKASREWESEKELNISEIQAVAAGEDIQLLGPQKKPAILSNWSFSQICNKAKSPVAYLQKLPASLAAMCLNHGLVNWHSTNHPDDTAKCKLLLHRETEGPVQVRAMTSIGYSRIFDERVIHEIRPALDLGWRVPPARPAVHDPRSRKATKDDILPNQENFSLSVKVGDMIAPAGVYRGDRDMFLFLVNPERIIDDGGKGLMRGIFISNSEVGAGAFSVQGFLLENVCGNHICWSATMLTNLRLIHRGEANKRFQGEMAAQLRQYHAAKSSPEETMITAAKKHILGKNKDEVVKLLFEMKSLQLSKRDIECAFDLAEKWEHTAHAPPVTSWGFVHGLTRHSQSATYADVRDAMDQAGGKILTKAMVLAG